MPGSAAPGISTWIATPELTRRAYIGHETSVKSIGSLCYLGAVIAGPASIVLFLVAAGVIGGQGPNADVGRIAGFLTGAVVFALFFLYAALGYGLTHLMTWARWTAVVLVSLGLLNNLAQIGIIAATNPQLLAGPIVFGTAFGLLISGYILYLLVTPKAGVVFSPSYKQVIAKTPHVKQKMSLILKIALVLLAGVVLLVVVAAVSSLNR